MPRIPLHFHQPAATPQSTVRADPGMFEPINRGAQAIAQGASAVAQTAGDFAQKLQDARNSTTIATTKREIEEAFDVFSTTWSDKRKQAEPEKWQSEWDDLFNGVIKKNERTGMGPIFKGQYETMVADLRQRTSAEVRKNSTARGIQNQFEAGKSNLDWYKKTQNVTAYQAEIERMQGIGVLSETDAKTLQRSAAHDFELEKRMAEARMAPGLLLETIKASTGPLPQLNEAETRQLANYAEAQFNKVKIDTLDEFNARQIAGQVIPQAEIDVALGSNLITKTQAAHLTYDARLRAAKDPEKQTPAYLEAMSLISAYDPATATTSDKAKILGALLPLAGTYAEDANLAFKEKRDPKSPLNSPAAKEAIALLKANLRDGVFGVYKFTVFDRDKGGYITKTDAAKELAAQERFARVYTVLEAYVRNAKTPPTLKELQEVAATGIGTLESDYISTNVSQAVGSISPDDEEAELDAILARGAKKAK